MFFYFYRYRSQYGTIAFVQVTGFEQVDTNGIPNYYVFDHNPSRVVQFDQNWNNVKNNRLPYQYGYNLKNVNGYFDASANFYFSKTDMNFNLTAS